ncbi:protein RER1C [Citrus sinensis]|nr:protein RER1C [Citrus sinensis]
METVPTATAATAEDFSSSSSSTSPTAAISRWKYNVSRRYQHLLDKSVPHVLHRWVVCLAVVSIYAVRVSTPSIATGRRCPPADRTSSGRSYAACPSSSSGRYCVTRSFCIGFVLTFFSAFDVPVFWPILLFYWLMLFTLTMRRQIMHMIKYRYVPFSLGKQRYDGKRPSSSDATSSED